jgi:hypothetical protein
MRSGPGPRPARNSTGGLTLPAAVPQAALTLERLRDELAAMQSYEEPQPGAPGCYFGVSTRRVAYPADDPLGRALYIGQVDLEGHRSGLGILMWADGSRYLGEWLGDKRSGHGVQLFSDGSSYTGQFLASRRHGHGAALAVDGAQRCGWWQFGELHAQDRYTLRAARRPSGRGAGAGAGAAGGDSASSSPPSGLNETVNFISSPGEEEAAVVAAGSGAGVQLRAEVNEALRSALAAAAEARANAEALGAERARELLALAASPGLPGWSVPRRLPAVVLLRFGLCRSPLRTFCVPIWLGLVFWFQVCTRSSTTSSPSIAGYARAGRSGETAVDEGAFMRAAGELGCRLWETFRFLCKYALPAAIWVAPIS